MSNRQLLSIRCKRAAARLATALLVLGTAAAQASPLNLVVNGGFEINTGNGQIGYTTAIDHWSSPPEGYNFLFAPGTADTTGAVGAWFDDPLRLWGANNGGANAISLSGDGGYMVGADGAYGVQPIEQLVEGLVAGRQYQLSFEWAAAQQEGFYGTTTEAWVVYFAGQVQATGIYTNPSQGASGWMNETMTFTANGSSALLSFLARGTPDGHPPFSLLDGVALVELPGQVPEPGSWLLFAAACAAALLGARRRTGPQA